MAKGRASPTKSGSLSEVKTSAEAEEPESIPATFFRASFSTEQEERKRPSATTIAGTRIRVLLARSPVLHPSVFGLPFPYPSRIEREAALVKSTEAEGGDGAGLSASSGGPALKEEIDGYAGQGRGHRDERFLGAFEEGQDEDGEPIRR